MRTRLTLAVLSLFGFFGTAAAIAPSAHAESTASAFSLRLVQLVNSARADHGLRPLTVASGTSTVAAGWTEHLAAAQALSHNPNLAAQLESHGSPNWTSYGENVGMGPTSSAQTLFNAYMNSPEHRANILGASYRYLGIAVVYTGAKAWNTMDFVDQYSSPTTVSQPAPVRQTTAVRATSPVHVATTRTAPVRHVASRRVTVHRSAPVSPVRATVKAVASTLPLDGPSPAHAHNVSLVSPMTPSAATHGHSRLTALPTIVAIWLILLGFTRFVLIRRQRAS
ncbi:MAG TPA: CAP domain-containing protein [Mycobacteriales bacterium]|nr:CAP domain-containing protein [Mycobacteriales bacterium]